VPIRDRSTEIEERSGLLEGDLLSGRKNTHVATLVERQSRFLMLVQVDGKDTASVVDALVRQAQHKRFAVAADVAVYFCDPRSPWQRGSNENTNGLLRQYLPRGSDLSMRSQESLDAVALRLNTRPRNPWLQNTSRYAHPGRYADPLNLLFFDAGTTAPPSHLCRCPCRRQYRRPCRGRESQSIALAERRRLSSVTLADRKKENQWRT
jgi:hypothetical protein